MLDDPLLLSGKNLYSSNPSLGADVSQDSLKRLDSGRLESLTSITKSGSLSQMLQNPLLLSRKKLYISNASLAAGVSRDSLKRLDSGRLESLTSISKSGSLSQLLENPLLLSRKKLYISNSSLASDPSISNVHLNSSSIIIPVSNDIKRDSARKHESSGAGDSVQTRGGLSRKSTRNKNSKEAFVAIDLPTAKVAGAEFDGLKGNIEFYQ
jgi:hypothetical protein